MSTAEQFDFYSVNAYLAAEALAATRNEFVNGLIRAMASATWTRNCIFSIVRARKAGFFKKLTGVDCVFGSQGLSETPSTGTILDCRTTRSDLRTQN